MLPKTPVPAAAPSAPADLDADIAASIAEEGDEPEPEPESQADEDESADNSDTDADSPVADEDSESPEEEPAVAPAPPASAADLAALEKAIAAGDSAAFVAALGPAAEKLLTGKAHKALRLQVKSLEQAQAKADLLATQLGQKYGDPIAARKAAEGGDVDAFITMVEKWAGHPWNDVARWVTNGIGGRPARLEQKTREDASAAQLAKAKQEQAMAELSAWVDGGVKKLAPELHSPDVVEMVVAEIRAGFASGITTPAKALPLARKKLEDQYRRLHAVFGGKAPKRPASAPAPSSRIAREETGGKTRELTLDEDIAEFMLENGLRSARPAKRGPK